MFETLLIDEGRYMEFKIKQQENQKDPYQNRNFWETLKTERFPGINVGNVNHNWMWCIDSQKLNTEQLRKKHEKEFPEAVSYIIQEYNKRKPVPMDDYLDLLYDNVELGDELKEVRTLYGTVHYINEKKTFMIMTCGIEEKKKLSVWIPAHIEIADRDAIVEGAVVDVRGILQIWHERKNEFQIKAEYIGLSRLENGEARQSEWINQLKQWQAEYKDEWTATAPPEIKITENRMALITAGGSAGKADFFALRKGNYTIKSYDITISSPEEIVQTIQAINDEADKYDFICIVRGGGDRADFTPFYHPAVIEAIVKSETPVTLALGHAYDMHYAAKVASETWLTPTDAIKGINALYFRNTNISDSDKIKVLEDEIHNLQQKLRRYEDRGFLAKVWDLFK